RERSRLMTGPRAATSVDRRHFRRGASLDGRRLSRVRADDVEPRSIRQPAHPVAAVSGDDDERSPDPGAKSCVGPNFRLFRRSWLGFGVAVVARREEMAAPVGSYGWGGAWVRSGARAPARTWSRSC